MKIAVLKESNTGEARVAVSPEAVKKYVGAGHQVRVQRGAGAGAFFSDADYKSAGAKITAGPAATLKEADVLLAVQAPSGKTASMMKRGAGIAALLEPDDDPDRIRAYAKARLDAYALEYIPRISRAQAMDVLSSQSNLTGYRAVVEGASLYNRALPMMMTAAGTIAPAKVFIMGAGVAGLQAIATARRLGAVTTATDVRPAAKEQVASLGAKFIAVEDDEFRAAETMAGYAKEMSSAYRKKQAELIAGHIAAQDIVVTTALIPGKPAPRLIDAGMVKSMKAGSVIIDLAAARGGNCALTRPGKIVTSANGVMLVGYRNWPARMASDSSALYARNLTQFLPLLCAEDGGYAPHLDDEIIEGCLLTHAGKLVHKTLKSPKSRTTPKKRAIAKTSKATKKQARKKTPATKGKKAPVKTRKKPVSQSIQAKTRSATKSKPKPKSPAKAKKPPTRKASKPAARKPVRKSTRKKKPTKKSASGRTG